jgi:Type IV secretion system pilin
MNKTFADIIYQIIGYFNTAIYVIMSLAVIFFVWNVFKYFIMKSDNPTERAEAGKYVLYSLIGFFVILSFWGLVNIFTNTFQLDNRPPTGAFPGSYNSSNTTNDSDWARVTTRRVQATREPIAVEKERKGFIGRAFDYVFGGD